MSLKLKYPYFKEPRGGWHWVKDDFRFSGKSPEEVIEKVRQHLLANSRPPGDLMTEFVAYVATHWPLLVENEIDPPAPKKESPLSRVLKINHELGTKPLLTIPDKEEQARRNKVCSQCPLNQPIKGDHELIKWINQRSYMLRRGKHSDLGYCAHHGWDNRVAVMWDEHVLKNLTRGDEKAARHCWLFSLLNGK